MYCIRKIEKQDHLLSEKAAQGNNQQGKTIAKHLFFLLCVCGNGLCFFSTFPFPEFIMQIDINNLVESTADGNSSYLQKLMTPSQPL